MKRTTHFRLPYLELGDYLYESDEATRMGTIDQGLWASTRAFGTGWLSGWAVTGNLGGVSVAAGTGILAGYLVTTTAPTLLTALEGAGTYGVYVDRAEPMTEADVTGKVCTLSVHKAPYTKGVNEALLATFAMDGAGVVTEISTATRDEARFLKWVYETARAALAGHRHKGVPGSPTKVDLATETVGDLPASRIGSIDGGTLTDVDFTDLPRRSHLGRKSEACRPKAVTTRTDDYRTYTSLDAWLGEACVVVVNGIPYSEGGVRAGETPYTANPATNSVTFGTAMAVTDQVYLWVDFIHWYPVKGPWVQPSGWAADEYITVTVDGTVVPYIPEGTDGTDRTDPGAGYITLASPASPRADVRATLRGVHVIKTGKVSHADLDDAISRVSDFGRYPDTVIHDQNAQNLLAAVHHNAPDTVEESWHQALVANLPEDWWDVIDDDASTVHPWTVTRKKHPSNPAGAGWDSEDLASGDPLGQSFMAAYPNVSEVDVYLSVNGNPFAAYPDMTVSVRVYNYSDTLGVPTTALDVDAPTLTAEDFSGVGQGAKRFRVAFTPATTQVLAGKQYAIVLEQSVATTSANCVRWHYTIDGRYPYGTALGWSTDLLDWDTLNSMKVSTEYDFSFVAWAEVNGGKEGLPGCGGLANAQDVGGTGAYQTFQHTHKTVWSAKVPLYGKNNGAGSLRAQLYAVGANDTLGALQATATAPFTTDLGTGSVCHTFYFGTSDATHPENHLKLASGQYALVLSDTTGVAHYQWGMSAVNAYPAGKAFVHTGTWAEVTGHDFYCDITCPDTTVDGTDGGANDADTSGQSLLSACAQSFQATLQNVTKVTGLTLHRVGDKTGYVVKVELWPAVDHVPAGALPLATATIPAGDVHPTMEDVQAVFHFPPPTVIGGSYCLKLSLTGGDVDGMDANNHIVWHYANDAYVGGMGHVFGPGGWTTLPVRGTNQDDFTFLIKGDQGLDDCTGGACEETISVDMDGVTITPDPLICLLIDHTGSNAGSDPTDVRFSSLTASTTGFIDRVLTAYPAAKFDVVALVDDDAVTDTQGRTMQSYQRGEGLGSRAVQLAVLGSAANMSNSAATVKGAVSYVKDYINKANVDVTALTEGIGVAVERLRDAHAATVTADRPEGAQMVIVCFSDGEDNTNAWEVRLPEVVRSIGETPAIQFYGIAYGERTKKQLKILGDCAKVNGAYYQIVEMGAATTTVLDAIRATTRWKSRSMILTRSFPKLRRLIRINLDADVPAGTTATFDIWLFGARGGRLSMRADGTLEVSGDVLQKTPDGTPIPYGTGFIPDTDIVFPDDTWVAQIGFVIHMKAGSSPVLHSLGIVVEGTHTDYIYTLPIETELPPAEIYATLPPGERVANTQWVYGLGLGAGTSWRHFQQLPDGDKTTIRVRKDEPLTQDATDARLFRAAYGPWSGDTVAVVYRDNQPVAASTYAINPRNGTIRFAQIPTDVRPITLSLTPPPVFRLGAELNYAGDTPPLDVDIATYWSLVPWTYQ